MNTLPLFGSDDNPPLKRCTGLCGRELPNTPEFFHRNGTYRSGNTASLRPECKGCRGNKLKGYYGRPEVAEQKKTYAKKYRTEHHEHVVAHKKAYYSRPEVKEHKRVYTNKYRKSAESKRKRRLEAIRYNSRIEVRQQKLASERQRLQIPEVRARRQERDRVNQHRRRARKKSVGGMHTPEQLQNLLTRQKGKCYYCQNKFARNAGKYVYHVEHTFPLSRVADMAIPANSIDYLVLACPSCNISKSNKFPWEWPKGGRLL